MIRHFRYVVFAEVPMRLAQGWMVEDVCPGHHGHYSCLMVWLCGCEVPG